MSEFAIIGTTASGKSDLALEIARENGGVILSLDSLCVYRKIDIASAKPSADELREIRHFGVNLVEPNEKFSAGDFAREYLKARDFALKNGVNLIITGGSGFYLKALLSGLAPQIPDCDEFPSNDEIWALAQENDVEFVAKFSANDTFRLQKWFSIFKFCGFAPSKFLRENTAEPVIKNLKIFEILRNKDEIHKRILARTNLMIERGLIDEARALFSEFGRDAKALKSIGLKECAQFLDGEISLEKLVELISTHTAQLAKRQRTFNRSQFNTTSADFDLIKAQIEGFLR